MDPPTPRLVPTDTRPARWTSQKTNIAAIPPAAILTHHTHSPANHTGSATHAGQGRGLTTRNMKKKSNQHTTNKTSTESPATQEIKIIEQPSSKPRHPDADWVQKTHFGYVGAYA